MSSVGKVQGPVVVDSVKVKSNAVEAPKAEKTVAIASDNIKINIGMKSGIVPLKIAEFSLAGIVAGAGAGALIGGIGSSRPGIGMAVGGAATVLPSIIAGIVSQQTDKMGMGALIGAGTGFAVGALEGAIVTKNLTGALLVGSVGALSGAVSGATSSHLSQMEKAWNRAF